MKSFTPLIMSSLLSGVNSLPSGDSNAASTTWAGWKSISYLFTFGDSYSTTGFSYSKTPCPSPELPLGNPGYPGSTSCDGPNWVDYLTVEYNASRMQTYNFAYSGATFDSALVAPAEPSILSVKQQIQNEFLPGYTGSHTGVPSGCAPAWTGANSVFAIWVGINDIGDWGRGESAQKTLDTEIFNEYASVLGQLWSAGARNFVFFTLPPMDRSPSIIGQGSNAETVEGAAVSDWNSHVTQLASSLKANYTADANVWVMDTHALLTDILNNPKSTSQTAAIVNTTTYCQSYVNGTPSPTTYDPSCGAPVGEFYWLNSLHMTFPAHQAVAAALATELKNGPNVS